MLKNMLLHCEMFNIEHIAGLDTYYEEFRLFSFTSSNLAFSLASTKIVTPDVSSELSFTLDMVGGSCLRLDNIRTYLK